MNTLAHIGTAVTGPKDRPTVRYTLDIYADLWSEGTRDNDEILFVITVETMRGSQPAFLGNEKQALRWCKDNRHYVSLAARRYISLSIAEACKRASDGFSAHYDRW